MGTMETDTNWHCVSRKRINHALTGGLPIVAAAIVPILSYTHHGEFKEVATEVLDKLLDALKLLGAGAVLSLGGLLLYSVAHKFTHYLQSIKNPWHRKFLNQSTLSIYRFLSTALISITWIAVLCVLLDRVVADNKLSSYITVDTIVSLAVGLAVRPLVGNVIDGFVIVISRRISLCDVILVPGTNEMGEVVDLGLLGIQVQITTNGSDTKGELVRRIHVPFSILQGGTITRQIDAPKPKQEQHDGDT